MTIFSLSLPERLELQVDTVTQAADAAARLGDTQRHWQGCNSAPWSESLRVSLAAWQAARLPQSDSTRNSALRLRASLAGWPDFQVHGVIWHH